MIREFSISITTNRIIETTKDIDNKTVEKQLIKDFQEIELEHYGEVKFKYALDKKEFEAINGHCLVGGYYNCPTNDMVQNPTTYGVILKYKMYLKEKDLGFLKKLFDFLISIRYDDKTDFRMSFTIVYPNLKHNGKFRTSIDSITVEYDSLKEGKENFNFNEFANYALNI